MRFACWSSFIIIAAACISVPAHAQNPDDDLKVYAVNVVKTPPLEKQFIGYGIYLGRGMVITAAHVVGHWPAITNPRVRISGQDLTAKVIKEGSFEQTDLALLAVDKEQLPISLRLRQNPLCKGPLMIGANVVVVYPDRTVRARIISPMLIAPQLRTRFRSLISDAQGSGSGVFDTVRRCLLGIMSSKMPKFKYRKFNGRLVIEGNGFAGHFVPSSAIADFIPPEFRFDCLLSAEFKNVAPG
jgi:hypothetical protein